MRRWLHRGLALIAVLAVLAVGGIWYIGAWNLVFPGAGYDSVAPALPAELADPAILVFSKTNGFRHRDGIAGGQKALRQISRRRGWGVYETENGAVFNDAQLSRFEVVVFLNASGDLLDSGQRQAFRSWLEAGGGWLGIHAAGDGSHQAWPWYVNTLIGANFTAHILGPQFQVATMVLERSASPVLAGLPSRWDHEEEWYSWEKSPRDKGFSILATVDEDSYQPVQNLPGRQRDLRMGDHPVVWSNCVAAGKSVYSALGHRADAFEQAQHLQLLENALAWLLDSGVPCQKHWPTQ